MPLVVITYSVCLAFSEAVSTPNRYNQTGIRCTRKKSKIAPFIAVREMIKKSRMNHIIANGNNGLKIASITDTFTSLVPLQIMFSLTPI
jgi:hypothetical protein